MARGLSYLIGVLLVGSAATCWGQKAPNWRSYKVGNGLPSVACGSVTVGPRGKVLVTHPAISMVTELDGYNIRTIPCPFPLQNRVYGSPAGQLWTVVTNGLLEFNRSSTSEWVWSLHVETNILAAFRTGTLRAPDPVPLQPVRQGLVLFLLPDRLLELDTADPNHAHIRVLRLAKQTPLGSFTGMCQARGDGGEGGLWIAGTHGLARIPGFLRSLKEDDEWSEYPFPAAWQLADLRELHEDKNGNVTGVAESTQTHQKEIVHLDNQQWSYDTPTVEKLRFAWRGPDGTCWAANPNTLFQYQPGGSEMSESEDITARAYSDVAVESGGAFWLATADGLLRYAALAWRTPAGAQKITTPIRCLTMDSEGRLWFVSGNALHWLRAGRHEEFAFPAETGHKLQGARALTPLRDGSLLLSAGAILARFEPPRLSPTAADVPTHPQAKEAPNPNTAGSRTIPYAPVGATGFSLPAQTGVRLKVLGALRSGAVCVQSSAPTGTNLSYRLEVSGDGSHYEPLPDPPPRELLGGELTSLFAEQNGDLWISGEQGIARFHDRSWRLFPASDAGTPRLVSGFAEAGVGKVWCSTEDRIWEFDGRDWQVVPGGFDSINALVRARDGSAWVAASGGMHRYLPAHNAWIQNGTEEGLPSTDIRQVLEDLSGQLWAGTARGLSAYDPEADRDPPLTRIRELTDTAKKVPEGGMIALSFSTSQDKWNYTVGSRLLFSYQLDTNEWTRFTDEANGVSFPDPSAGAHLLRVRAMDRSGNLEPKAATFGFAVVLPWWKETRLVMIALAGLVGALFFAGLAFNRHQRLVRSYAEVERKVAERTRELELANRELLHSQKMTALGTLAAGVAHDFNNILSIIQGSAQIIEDNVDNPNKIRTRVDRIKTVVEQGAGIVKAMLGFSRDSGQEPAQCDINAVVEDTIRLLGDRFLRDADVKFNPAPSLPPLAASKDFIQQMLLNFIFNAAESMAGRKQIILATGLADKLASDLVLAPAKARRYVTVAVRDFGCGISPANLPRIFEPFFTTKAFSARRGTGLGLSMVYKLASKMGAGLTVDSVVEQGSTFTLILPVSPTDTHLN